MTDLEERLAVINRVLERRGYLVMACVREEEIGAVYRKIKGMEEYDHPFMIIGKTDRQDWLGQLSLIAELWAGPVDDTPDTHCYYYRVVTD